METKMWQAISRVSKNGKIIVTSITLLVVILLISYFSHASESRLLTKSEADILLRDKTLSNLVIKEPYIYFEASDKQYKIAKDAYSNEELFALGKVEYAQESSDLIDNILMSLLLLTVIYLIYSARQAQSKQVDLILEEHSKEEENANTPQIKAQHSAFNFSDVAGLIEVKEELQEVIDFLKYPKKYQKFDIKLPKGVLLVGPPGVGKTLIAKAVAGEANVPFFYHSAASFVQIYVGMGAKRVSELFAQAKAHAPSIIFIDEIDAVGKIRGEGNNEEREATLNQLLTEMDGFEDSSGVMVIAATNKIEVLDDALLRAGRFDRRVHIGLPDFTERMETLQLYLKSKKHTINIEKASRLTIGFNSAALSTLINESALHSLRLEKDVIDESDLEAVREKVLLGKFKIQNFSEQERRIQALYQSAKAITATWLEIEFEKIGILSSHFVPHHNEIFSQTFLENELKVLLAGRIATKNHYGELFSNAKEDIKSAKHLSRQITEEFFMIEGYHSHPNQAEQLLADASDEVTTLLSKLDAVVVIVKEYLLDNESITMKKTKELIGEVF